MGALLDPIDLQALTRAAHGVLTLTPAEYRVLKSFLRGNRPDMIAQELGLTKMTAQMYLKKIYRKCGCDRLTLMRLSFALDSIPTINRHLSEMGSIDDRRRRPAMHVADPSRTGGVSPRS
jgi:DNA-binding CsgD family transcriptional regulator